jgi:hypothetical protein
MATFTTSIINTKKYSTPTIEVNIVDLDNVDDVSLTFNDVGNCLFTTVFMTRKQAEQLLLKLSEALD